MNEFDLKAAGWDENKMHWERSQAIVKGIIRNIPLRDDMIAMEYGAGTGIASFMLKDHLKEITLMDNSREMIKVMDNKILSSKAENLKTLWFDLEHNEYKDKKFDLIFTQMVLHHVSDIETIITRFSKLLNNGGYLAIADLYKEDGSFHGDGFTGHKGFDPENLAEIISKNHFTDVNHFRCFTINRKLSDTETKNYDVFLLTVNLSDN